MRPVGVRPSIRAVKSSPGPEWGGPCMGVFSPGLELNGFFVSLTLSGPHPIARASSVAAWEKSTSRYVLRLGGSSRTIRWPRRKPKAGGVERHMGLPVRAETAFLSISLCVG